MKGYWSQAGANRGEMQLWVLHSPIRNSSGVGAWCQSLASLGLAKVKCLLYGALSEPASSAAMCPPNAGQDAQLAPGCLDGDMGCNPLPAAMAKAGWGLPAPSLPEAAGGCGDMEGSGTRAMLVARRCLAGIAPEGSSMLGSWQQDLLHWGGFVLFFLVVFLKTVPFAILPVFHKTFPGRTSPKLLGIQLLKGVGVKDICASVQC